MAPVSPFMSEHIYLDMFGKKFSVHAEDWPKKDAKLVNKSLDKSMETVRELIEAMNSAREDRKIKLKWPLDAVHVFPKDRAAAKAVKDLSDVIIFLGNVREVRTLAKASRGMKAFPGGNLGLGDILEDESLVRELVRTVQVMRKKKGLKVTDMISLGLSSDKSTESVLKKHEKEILSGVGGSEISWSAPAGSESFALMGKTVKIGFRRS